MIGAFLTFLTNSRLARWIGIAFTAVAAMAGAVERPFSAGKHPITPAQVDALIKLVRDLCRGYGIPVTRETVLSHAEVQPTLGIKQRGKWDIAWLPGYAAPVNPVRVGDDMRARIGNAAKPAPRKPVVDPPVASKPVVDKTSPDPVIKPATGLLAAILRALVAIFGGKK